MIKIIDGKNVYLRRLEEADTDNILRWRNMPHVVERFIYRIEVTRADHEKWLSEQVGKGLVEQFIIVVKATGQEIGSQYFSHIDKENGIAEFGIFIGEKDAIGHHYGTEVLQLSLKYAFEEMNMQEIILRVLEDNERAIRSYKNCGFEICPELTEEMVLDGIRKRIIFMKRDKNS
ncbi:MAG: GNAT family N-acetyltransferase [Lachnospiraceae bacterium]|nr:GNAT family N-acetyltransferase [Lachnospiraceae bacterium]